MKIAIIIFMILSAVGFVGVYTLRDVNFDMLPVLVGCWILGLGGAGFALLLLIIKALIA